MSDLLKPAPSLLISLAVIAHESIIAFLSEPYCLIRYPGLGFGTLTNQQIHTNIWHNLGMNESLHPPQIINPLLTTFFN